MLGSFPSVLERRIMHRGERVPERVRRPLLDPRPFPSRRQAVEVGITLHGADRPFSFAMWQQPSHEVVGHHDVTLLSRLGAIRADVDEFALEVDVLPTQVSKSRIRAAGRRTAPGPRPAGGPPERVRGAWPIGKPSGCPAGGPPPWPWPSA